MTDLRIAIGCVADTATKYLFQATRFVSSIRQVAGDRPGIDVFIGYFDGTPDYCVTEFERLGAKPRKLEKVTDLHGPSNKMAYLRLPELREYDVVFLCDCDVIFVRDFMDMMDPAHVRAKSADTATLPDRILTDVFRFANKPFPPHSLVSSIGEEPTILYCNSGVIALGREVFVDFVDEWFRWNDALLQNQKLLGNLRFFTDQASFSLTLDTFKARFREFPVEMNFPAHYQLSEVPKKLLEVEPIVVHYHDMVDPLSGLVDVTELANLQAPIAHFNAGFRTAPGALTGPLFWDYANEEIATGSLDADMFRAYKQAIIDLVLARHEPRDVLDLGCGGRPLIDGGKVAHYTGVDWSSGAIGRARAEDPIGTYHNADLLQAVPDTEPDLVLLVDVLPYVADPQAVEELLAQAIAAGSGGDVLISGLAAPQRGERPVTFFHGGIADMLQAATSRPCALLGRAAGQEFYLVQKQAADKAVPAGKTAKPAAASRRRRTPVMA